MTDQPDPIELLKIGKFAKLAKTNLRTLRYYEELGLVTPSRRSKGGFRYYRPTDLARVEMIQFLQELGLPLEEIRNSLKGIPDDNFRGEWLMRLRENENPKMKVESLPQWKMKMAKMNKSHQQEIL